MTYVGSELEAVIEPREIRLGNGHKKPSCHLHLRHNGKLVITKIFSSEMSANNYAALIKAARKVSVSVGRITFEY